MSPTLRAHAIVDAYVREMTGLPSGACPLTCQHARDALDERVPWESGPGPGDALVDACYAAMLARWAWHVAQVPSRLLDAIEANVAALEGLETTTPLSPADQRRAIALGARLGVRPPPL